MEFISRDGIAHCIKRNPNRLEGRATAGMLIIFLVLSLLGWIYLTQASHVATTSRRNQDLEAEKALLRQENMELMVEMRPMLMSRPISMPPFAPKISVAAMKPTSGLPAIFSIGVE